MNSNRNKCKIWKPLGLLIFACLPLTIEAMFGCGIHPSPPPPYVRPYIGNGFKISFLPVTAAVFIVPGLVPSKGQLTGIGPVPGPGLGPVVWPQPDSHFVFGKPGWCPAPGNIGGGCQKCQNDYSCPGKQKCCTTSSLAPCCTAVK